jgi:hypothetical protein
MGLAVKEPGGTVTIHIRIEKCALVAMLAFGATSCMMAQNGGEMQQAGTAKRGVGEAAATSPPPVANGYDSAGHLVIADRGVEPDPNMPNMAGKHNGAIFWTVDENGPSTVTFIKPTAANGRYLGFNDRGSWILHQNDRKVYVWNGQDRSLTVGAESMAAMPLDVIASLRNSKMRAYLAKRMNNGDPATPAANSGTPAGGGAFTPGTNPASNPMGAVSKLTGERATIRAGVLTFIVNDPASPYNGKPVSYKVVRPAIAIANPNAPRPNDITGQWVGEDPNNRDAVLLFFVQGNTGAVSMQAMSGPAAAAMKRMLVPAQQ